MSSPELVNTALLMLRVLLGLLLAAHGMLKFLQRGGLDAEVALLKRDGLRGGTPVAAFSAVVQVGAGTLLAVGFLTPLAGAGAIGAMVVAVFAKARNGFWVFSDGLEFPLIFAVLAVIATLAGPRQWSIDHVAGLTPTSTESLLAVGAGVVLGALTFPVPASLLRPQSQTIRSTQPRSTGNPSNTRTRIKRFARSVGYELARAAGPGPISSRSACAIRLIGDWSALTSALSR